MALDDLTDAEANSKIQLYIESRKRKRMSRASDAIAAQLTSIGTETVETHGGENRTNFSLEGGKGSSGVNGLSLDKFVEERDVEMEVQIAEEFYKTDGFSDYDIEVTKEGEAINEYLAMLDSA